MSRTKKRTGSNSPVKRYLSFAGGKGKIKFYDKEDERADDKGNVYLDELDFIVLDIKSSISGYNEKASAGISSNLIDPYSTKKVPFTVRTKVDGKYGVFTEGLYDDIKDVVSKIGGKFTTNIFALADVGDGNGLQLVRLELNGAGLSPWIEFTNKLENDEDIYDLQVTVKQGQLCTRKKGKTVKVSDAEYKKIVAAIQKDPLAERPVLFYEPQFAGVELAEEEADMAIEADEKLQAYFDASGDNKGQGTDDSDSTPSDDVPNTSPKPAAGTDEEDDDDLPF